jgi:hypothetical protein
LAFGALPAHFMLRAACRKNKRLLARF